MPDCLEAYISEKRIINKYNNRTKNKTQKLNAISLIQFSIVAKKRIISTYKEICFVKFLISMPDN